MLGYFTDKGVVIGWVMWFQRWDVWLVFNIPILNLLLFHFPTRSLFLVKQNKRNSYTHLDFQGLRYYNSDTPTVDKFQNFDIYFTKELVNNINHTMVLLTQTFNLFSTWNLQLQLIHSRMFSKKNIEICYDLFVIFCRLGKF